MGLGKLGSATSASWGTKKEELEGRAAINDSQIRKYTAHNEARFADHVVSQDALDAERDASKKRKQMQNDDINAFAEAQKASSDAAPKASGLLVGRAKAESKAKKAVGFVVKKPKVDEHSMSSDQAAAEAASAASTKEPPAALGIGLAGYGSSSEEEDVAA